MDRFIVKSDWKALIDEFILKSNMDRFIVIGLITAKAFSFF